MASAVLPDVRAAVKAAAKGNDQAVAELISLAEDFPECRRDMVKLMPPRAARHLVGLTGPPGCGKSTLVDKLISRYRKRGQTVGVVAVDPTSPTTGGAILGDRIRMSSHFTDPGVFIRSMASRGELGGIAKSTSLAAGILAASKDIVLIETVGVGQLEVSVRGTVDTLAVVLTPASGDDIQFMKAGIMEVADLFVVNKSEDPKSERTVQLLQEYVRDQFAHAAWVPPVVTTAALENKGIDDLVKVLDDHRRQMGRGSLGRSWAERGSPHPTLPSLGTWRQRSAGTLYSRGPRPAPKGGGKSDGDHHG